MAADRRAVKAKLCAKPTVSKKPRRKKREKNKASDSVSKPKSPQGRDSSLDKRSFYKSMEWRQLRYLAIRNSGGCNCCGATANDGVRIHVDHIKPISQYPELRLSLDNVQVLCEDCNVGKGSWDQTDWRLA